MKKTDIEQFKVIVRRGIDGYFVASVPALPGCHTQAKSYEALHKRIREAIQLCLEVAKTDRSYQRVAEPTFIGVEDVAIKVS